MTAASTVSARLSLGFSCVGHTYSHLFAPIFYVVVLALEKDMALTHGQAVALIVAGNMLFGFAAPLAGWLGDRWSATGMMGFFYLGTGAGMVLTAFAATPFQIGLGLAVTGLFAAIYHPVGIAWLVRNSVNRGTALGLNNMFGSFGPAGAALIAGLLIDISGWRAAFLWPGVVIAATGVLFFALMAKGLIVETKTDRRIDPPTSRRDAVRALTVMAVTVLCTGLIYQATQPAIPKLFSERVADLTDGVFGVSALVAIVYATSGVLQIVAGRISDAFPAKAVYLVCFALQVPLLFLAGVLGGAALVAVAMAMVMINAGGTPAENMLFARYVPSQWRSFAFGIKFIVALGIAGLGVKLEGWLYDLTGGFYALFVVLAGLAALALIVGALLPPERTAEAKPAPAPVPAPAK
jgi:MFS family permease